MSVAVDLPNQSFRQERTSRVPSGRRRNMKFMSSSWRALFILMAGGGWACSTNCNRAIVEDQMEQGSGREQVATEQRSSGRKCVTMRQ